ncbi:hypothetical protein [Domibacillus aminovorans]|uniref:Immunity protein 12 domain-containing protein n=1 Tax=Domibacillus aminovorans TaxID=29332 RepID=A0A177L4Z8_9BACI|nr:hypothetical protein [Domibacillus aminovorans]OAH59861.1 hypothetical protein AWH49_18225 [Domibacillus aminovorans]
MEKDNTTYITFGSQMGDENAARAVQPHLIKLRILLEKYCDNSYCREVDEFAPILRVDGDGWYWEFEGCEKLRLSKKYRYITVDIGMPRSKWENVEPKNIRGYLVLHFKNALDLMIRRLKKEKYVVSENDLWNDFKKVEDEFLLT